VSVQNGDPALELSARSNKINFHLQECENPRDIIEHGTDIPEINVFNCAISDMFSLLRDAWLMSAIC
jgi:hypothetical protein